jgi:broad-specificity NMP kinase
MLACMLLLVTGASGAGKSTARRLIADRLGSEVEAVELIDLVEMPPRPTIAWRQQAAEVAVRRAVEIGARERHLLLAGDPVAAGEVVAAPSAEAIDIAACLLDVDPRAQTTRLNARGEDPALLRDNIAFAAWMRGHARDPAYMPHVLTEGGWAEMRWDRWVGRSELACSWEVHVIDTSAMTAEHVADEVLGWCRQALAGRAPLLHRADAGPNARAPAPHAESQRLA